MITFAIVLIALFELFIIISLFSYIVFLTKRKKSLIDELDFYKVKFNNATDEITRLSLLLIKQKRDNSKDKEKDDIVLELNAILDKISKVGYDNLSKEEKDYLKNSK